MPATAPKTNSAFDFDLAMRKLFAELRHDPSISLKFSLENADPAIQVDVALRFLRGVKYCLGYLAPNMTRAETADRECAAGVALGKLLKPRMSN